MMNTQECLERAMFAASESYSHSAYGLEEWLCGKSGESEGAPVLLGKETLTPTHTMQAI